MAATPACPEAIPIGDKVAFLTTLPGVEQVIETHMAFVFLTDVFAFKLKKPVSFGYFDHRTLAARAWACFLAKNAADRPPVRMEHQSTGAKRISNDLADFVGA